MKARGRLLSIFTLTFQKIKRLFREKNAFSKKKRLSLFENVFCRHLSDFRTFRRSEPLFRKSLTSRSFAAPCSSLPPAPFLKQTTTRSPWLPLLPRPSASPTASRSPCTRTARSTRRRSLRAFGRATFLPEAQPRLRCDLIFCIDRQSQHPAAFSPDKHEPPSPTLGALTFTPLMTVIHARAP